jgi:type I restriction enzyme S subunit
MSFPRYLKYKASGVEWLGEVPEHWEVRRLKQACTATPSNVDKKSHEGEKQVRLCNYVDVYYNDEITEAIDFMVATASDDQITKFTLRAGDTIITKDSETADDIAIAAFVPRDLPGVVCGYHLSMIRPRSSVDGRFIKWLFGSRYAKGCFAVLANGLTRVGLGQHDLENIDFAFPPLAEQRAIAAFLDRETKKIDELVAEQERLIELLKEKRQAVISHAVTKGLDPAAPMKPSGVEWLGDVPAHWTVWKLVHAFEMIGSGTTPRSDNPAYYEGGDIAWVNTGDLTDGELPACERRITRLAVDDYPSLRLYPAGALLVAMYGATTGKLGLLRFAATVNQACCAFVGESRIRSRFLFYWLFSYRAQLLSLASGGGQPNISQEVLRGLRVAAPSLGEQDAIITQLATACADADALVTQAESAILLLTERRSALISAAVTGQIDVRNAVPRATPTEAA